MSYRTNLFLTILLLVFVPSHLAAAGEWIPTQNPACIVWSEYPEPGETAAWSGKCAEGKADGFGELTWFADGLQTQKYQGTLVAGKKHGSGKFTLANGDVFEGMFRNNLRNGRGILRKSDGTYEAGFWLENRRVNNEEYSSWLRKIGAHWTVDDLRIAGIVAGDVMTNPPSALGTPLSDKLFRPQVNEGRLLEYPGLTLSLIKLNRSNSFYILRFIEVTSLEYPTERGIRVGDSLTKVLALYGTPNRQFICPPEKYCQSICHGDNCLEYYFFDTGLGWLEGDQEKEKAGLGFGLKDGKIVTISIGVSFFL